MADPSDRAKAAAAEAAVAEVGRGEAVALGTGSTAAFAVRAIARRFPDGGDLRCVASSLATAELARSLGLAVHDLGGGDEFELMLDGADEVDARLDLTKGGGGALFREKLLARRARHLLIMVDPSKIVERLGTRAPIPIEVVPYAGPVILDALAARGLPSRLRSAPDGTPYRTDNGLAIVDISPRVPVAAPARLEAELRAIPGVVETGLFLGLAERVYVGHPDGTATTLHRP